MKVTQIKILYNLACTLVILTASAFSHTEDIADIQSWDSTDLIKQFQEMPSADQQTFLSELSKAADIHTQIILIPRDKEMGIPELPQEEVPTESVELEPICSLYPTYPGC